MRGLLIAIFVFASISAFAESYDCKFTLLEGVDQDTLSLSDNTELHPRLSGTDESRLKVAKKSVKIKLEKWSTPTTKGQMVVTVWVDDSTAVGPEQNEGYMLSMVSMSVKEFQISSQFKGTYYNLVCLKK